MSASRSSGEPFRILSLDGGGAKGFYTLGVLREIQGMIKCPLYERFNLIYGTSTGAIIASLIALGYEIDVIHDLYKSHVPNIMAKTSAKARTRTLSEIARLIFGETTFRDAKTGIGVVATKWVIERPMIFKANIAQAHGRAGTFVP